MGVQFIKTPGGEDLVLLSRSDYDELVRQAQDAAVIQADLLTFPVFEEQLPVIAAGQRGLDVAFGGGTVQFGARAFKEKPVGRGQRCRARRGHAGYP